MTEEVKKPTGASSTGGSSSAVTTPLETTATQAASDDTSATAGSAAVNGSSAAPTSVPAPLQQTVEITDIGPCKKHVKVTVAREQIDQRLEEKISRLMLEQRPAVRGFRPGKAPRKLVERIYRDQVAEEVKNEVLMASMEQLAEMQKLAPLSPPQLDPFALTLPESGPFIYEFDVEVRPDFQLPSYRGLKIRRPVHHFTQEEVDAEVRLLLERYGQIVPKEGTNGTEPVVEPGDYISATVVVINAQGHEEARLEEQVFKVRDRLLLRPLGAVEEFGKLVAGRRAGETIEAPLVPTEQYKSAQPGTIVRVIIQEIKSIRLPELTPEFLQGSLGVDTPEQLAEKVRQSLDERLREYQLEQARRQVLEQLLQAVQFDIPEDLLQRQARRLLQRRILQLSEAGYSEEEIRPLLRRLQREATHAAHLELRQHFLLQKIAEEEKIEVSDDEIDQEIQRLAQRQGISYRRMKARVEKEDLTEALAAQLLERKALEAVLQHLEYEDYEWKPAGTTEQLVTPEEPPADTASAEQASQQPNTDADQTAASAR
jgi:trigger factor